MATPRKMHFDVGQRVRLSRACDGIHPDGFTATRVSSTTLVEITGMQQGAYTGKYAHLDRGEWKFGQVRLDFVDAVTVLGRPLFPGPLDRELEVRPQDQDPSQLNASGTGSGGGKVEDKGEKLGTSLGTGGAGTAEGEGTGQGTPSGAAAGDAPSEKDPKPVGDMTNDELAEALAEDEDTQDPQDSPQDAETTSDTETETMPDSQKDAAAALAAALNPPQEADAPAPPQSQQDNDLEKRVAQLERIDAGETRPVREDYPKLAKKVVSLDKVLTGMAQPLTTFMQVTGSNIDTLNKDVVALQGAVATAVADAAKAAADAAKNAGAPSEVIHTFNTPTQVIKTQKGDRAEVVETLRRVGLGFKNILWVGPAGCGKTSMAAMIAERLGIEVGDATCSPGMSETIWTGRLVPNIATGQDHYKVSLFAHLFEHGGVFLTDEMDNSDPSSLLAINTALANGYFTLPDGRRIVRHAKFVMLGAMNTYGSGADRVYVGRAQLDGASLDRYVGAIITVGYDKGVEMGICGGTGDATTAKSLFTAVTKLRQDAAAAGIRQIISFRWTEACVRLMAGGATIPEAFRICAEAWSESDRMAIGIAK